MSFTEADVQGALKNLTDPNTKKDFISSKSVKNIKINGSDVSLDILLGYPAKSVWDDIRKLVKFKKGTAKKAPVLTFPQGLTAELAEKTKALFPDMADAHKAIDDALIAPPAADGGDEQQAEESQENQE